jgi:hypothetical protein
MLTTNGAAAAARLPAASAGHADALQGLPCRHLAETER